MKKFFSCILILLIFGAILFFIGWTQVRVSPDGMGIVVSKLHGVDETPVLPGVFSFSREFLLPTNAELKKFSLRPYSAAKTISGELPSNSFYATSKAQDFSYHFTFSVEAHVVPEQVISLYKDNVISDSADLSSYLERIMDSVCQDAANFYLKKASENPDFRVSSLTIVDLFKGCDFDSRYPNVVIDVLALTDSAVPDYELYHYIRKNMLSGKNNSENKIEAPKADYNKSPDEDTQSENSDSETVL